MGWDQGQIRGWTLLVTLDELDICSESQFPQAGNEREVLEGL